MTGVIVVLPKIDDAKNMKNLLVRKQAPAQRARKPLRWQTI